MELIQNVYNAICDFNQVALGSQPENELIIDDEYISNYTKTEISKGMLHASLKFLENAGYLKQVSEFEKKDTVQILMGSRKIEEFVRRTSNEEIRDSLLVLLREFGTSACTEHSATRTEARAGQCARAALIVAPFTGAKASAPVTFPASHVARLLDGKLELDKADLPGSQ